MIQGASIRGRHSPPATLAQEGKRSKLCEVDMGPRFVVGVNWRLDNAKSPAVMLQESNPDATCINVPYIPGILLQVLATYICVSEFVATEFLPLSSTTNRHGHLVCRMPKGGKSS